MFTSNNRGDINKYNDKVLIEHYSDRSRCMIILRNNNR
jgi:hypothetical protein